MEKPKQALLITYYWPPAGGPGVHRWLRFSNYFASNGWKLHVYCPDEAAWPIRDEELLKEVSPELTLIRRPIFEPHKYLGKKNNPNVGGGVTRSEKSSLIQKMIIWIRGNLFIPDARKFWIKPSVRYISRYLKAHPEITSVITTGPPHSLHVIGLKLKRKMPHIHWMADFRDPWTQIDFYDDLMTGARADRKQKALEKACLMEADEVITVSDACAEGLELIGNRHIEVITNGFPFEQRKTEVFSDPKFSIAHFGSMPEARNPKAIWKALAQLLSREPELRDTLEIRLYGAVDYAVKESIEQAGLSTFMTHVPMVSHQESIRLQQQSQLLLLVANNTGNVKGILTGKVFEYLAAKRPVLAYGEAGSNLESLINYTEAGYFVPFDDETVALSMLNRAFENYLNQQDFDGAVHLDEYDSAVLAARLIRLLR